MPATKKRKLLYKPDQTKGNCLRLMMTACVIPASREIMHFKWNCCFFRPMGNFYAMEAFGKYAFHMQIDTTRGKGNNAVNANFCFCNLQLKNYNRFWFWISERRLIFEFPSKSVLNWICFVKFLLKKLKNISWVKLLIFL